MRYLVLATLLFALLAPRSAALAQPAQPAQVFAAALEKTAALQTYRLRFTARATGTMAAPLAETPALGEVVLADFSGLFARGDVGLTYRATDAGVLGFDPQRMIEMLVVRGTTYAVGPLPLGGAAEQRWYNLGGQSPPVLRPPMDASTALNILAGGIDPEQLTRLRFEQLDGKRCSVLRGSAESVTAALVRFGRPVTREVTAGVAQQLRDARLERAEYLAWLCDDGYVRQIRVTVSGYQPPRRADRFSADLLLRVSDIGSRSLRVLAPRDALRLRPAPVVSAAVVADTTLLSAPSPDAPPAAKLLRRESVQLLDRSGDGRWYRVRAPAAVGWLPATALPPATAQRRLPVAGQAAPPAIGPAATPGPTSATPTTATPAAGTPPP
ncbi:MAG: hypothetical protein RLZZ387_2482 [Chloroflexota bacterium]|jgi:hypothetical protein